MDKAAVEMHSPFHRWSFIQPFIEQGKYTAYVHTYGNGYRDEMGQYHMIYGNYQISRVEVSGIDAYVYSQEFEKYRHFYSWDTAIVIKRGSHGWAG